jgi:hypothetical protein
MKNIDNTRVVVFPLIMAVVVLGGVFALNNQKQDSSTTVTSAQNSAEITVESDAEDSSIDSTEELLVYLIEEEKLAHDVYSVMYEKYGSKVFGNILESESTHQERVLELLSARGIEDPRSSDVGVFENEELQSLYNNLISQGSLSAEEAFKVGVIVEEKDIADISSQLETATDQDVIDTLEDLRSASEKHLRAFNRQLG